MNDKTKILVTGASGFVGSAVINQLQDTGRYEIWGIAGSRALPGSVKGHTPARIFAADISDYKNLKDREEFKDTKVIIHSAGLAHQFGNVSKEDFWRVNVEGTANICRSALETGAGHLILISSVAVYGDHGDSEIDETFSCKPSGAYAESKLKSENTAIAFCERNEICLTILRLATVIGEGDRGNTARLITAIDKGRFIRIGEGTNRKSLIYKKDAARGILKAAEAGRKNGTEIFNLTGEAVSMRKCVDAISEALNKKSPRLKISEGLVGGIFSLNKKSFSFEYINRLEKTFEKWLSNDIFSGRKFYDEFSFKPETGVSEALKKQVNYYLKKK